MRLKIHRFYINFVFFAAIIIATALAIFTKLTFFRFNIWPIISSVLFLVSWMVARKYCLILICLSGVILAFWRSSNFNFNSIKVLKFEKEIILVKGSITEDPDIGENKEIKIKIDVSEINGKKASGRVYGILKTKQKIRRSDEVVIKGKASAGFGGYNLTIYRANLINIKHKAEFIRDVRDYFADKIRKFIPSPEVDLGLGYLLGQKNSLPNNLDNALRVTSLTHIVVASGYNLTILVIFTRRIFEKFSRRLSLLIGILLVCGFVLLVGFSPSMMRAGIVALISLFMWFFGRRLHPYFLLIFVASVTLLIDPSNILNLGWQLSFGSFFGVMILAPLLKEFFFEKPEKVNSLVSTFFETLSAQVSTLPLIIFTFGAFSSVSIPANLLVLPFVPLAMMLTFLTGIFAIIFPLFANIFGFLAGSILNYSVLVINSLSKISNAQVELKIGVFEAITSSFLNS